MLFQLAHWHMHGHAASTYESANTSAFKHGMNHIVSLLFLACFCEVLYCHSGVVQSSCLGADLRESKNSV